MNESIKSDVIIDKHAEPIDELNGFGILIPFVKELGFVLDFYDSGKSQITYSPKPEHLNSFQVAHGGAVMTLMDVSMATAARSVDKSLGIVTIEMKTSFLRPSTGQLIAKGELMHRTRTTAFVESKILNELGELCAHSTGTFRYVQRKPAEVKETIPDKPHFTSDGPIATD
jgi:uncharacterized protein (TIGR00369 family)